MAIEKTIELNLDASEAQKALNKFGGTLEDVYGEGVQPLNFAIGELEDRLYEMAAAGDTSSRQFMEMSAEVGRMKKVIIDTDLVLDGMSQNMAQKVGGAIGGLASGFELAQGAMATFGVESEAVEETLLKVQSAMAISQGFQGIREAIPSFKALSSSVKMFGKSTLASVKTLSTFKKALIGTGIGAVIVLLGELIANWDKYKAMLEDLSLTIVEDLIPSQKQEVDQLRKIKELGEEELEQSQDKLKALEKEIEATKNANSIETQKYDDAIRLAKAQGKSTKEIERLELEKLKTIIESAEKELELQKQKAFALRDEILAKAALGQLDEEAKEAAFEALRSQIETTKSTFQALKTARVDLQVFEAEKNNEKAQNYKETVDKQIEEEKRLAEELSKIKEEARLAQIAEEEELSEVIRRARLDEQEKEIEDINTHYFNLIERAKQHGLDTAILEEEQNAKIKEINDKYEEERKAKEEEAKQKEKDANDEKVANERELRETQLQMASDALGAIGELVTSFAGESEEAQRRAFNINKAISIGQAIISTAQGVMAQLAVPQDALTGANFIKAGIVAATGVAQVATIARTQFNPSGGSGGGASSINAPQAPSQAPTFNVVGNTGVNQLAETLGSSPMQAYVVAGDVTTAQSLERNKIEQSTL